MNNNDVLRRTRYTFNFDDSKMMAVFELGGLEVTRAEISDWLKKDDDPDYQKCSDRQLASFLNGLRWSATRTGKAVIQQYCFQKVKDRTKPAGR